MAELLTIDRMVTWSGDKGQHPKVTVDGVCVILDKEENEYYIPFRAEDKGGEEKTQKPYIWKWENPQDPIGDVTIQGDIELDTEEEGSIISGSWVGD